MDLDYLKNYAKEKSKENPELKSQIWDFYQLACDECEDECASETNEVEHAISAIDQYIENPDCI